MKLDEEAHHSLGPYPMFHLGHDHRRLFCLHDDLASERRFDDVGQPARQNVEDTPHAGLCRVIREESRRHGVFIEVGRPLIRHETSRQFEPIATHAVKLGSEKGGPSFGSQHPFAHLERRLMAHVLPMAATEIRDPVSPLVLMECLNLALHTRQLGLRRHLLFTAGERPLAAFAGHRRGDRDCDFASALLAHVLLALFHLHG